MTPEQNNELAGLIADGMSIVRLENETQQQLSKQRPRDPKMVLKKALEELEMNLSYASRNFYVIPYRNDAGGTTNVEGLSINAAMTIGRLWGNCAVGARITQEDEKKIIVEGVCLDYETNFKSTRPVVVQKKAYRKSLKQEIELDARQLTQEILSGVSKSIRNSVLAMIPDSIKIAYWERSKELAGKGKVAGKKAVDPLPVRMKSMFSRFDAINVTTEMICKYLEKAREEITEADLGQMVGVYNSIMDNERTIADYFGSESEKEDKEASTKVDTVLNGKKDLPVPAEKNSTGLFDDGGVHTEDTRTPFHKLCDEAETIQHLPKGKAAIAFPEWAASVNANKSLLDKSQIEVLRGIYKKLKDQLKEKKS